MKINQIQTLKTHNVQKNLNKQANVGFGDNRAIARAGMPLVAVFLLGGVVAPMAIQQPAMAGRPLTITVNHNNGVASHTNGVYTMNGQVGSGEKINQSTANSYARKNGDDYCMQPGKNGPSLPAIIQLRQNDSKSIYTITCPKQ